MRRHRTPSIDRFSRAWNDPRYSRRRGPPLLALALGLGLSLSCGAGSKDSAPPAPTLGATLKADRAMLPLIHRWMQSNAVERLALDADLAYSAKTFAGDPLARLCQVLRGWNALDRGQGDAAVALVKPALDGPPGTAHDLAQLIVGAAARRAGHAGRALAALMPLLHKMLDAPETALLDEELVRAAVDAGRWQDALSLMDVWLFEAAPGERDALLAKIGALLPQIPGPELLSAARRRTAGGIGLLRPEERRLAQAIAQHLARQAALAKDVALARVLILELGPLLGPEGEQAARLAADTSRARVAARTVGLLLSLGSSALERRSAEVLSGMAFGLGIGDSDARLVARDDGGKPDGVQKALVELAAEGAAVIVAGVDPRHGAAAVALSDRVGLPLVLLTPDARSSYRTSPQVFLLGAEPADSVGLLSSALRASGAKVVAGLGAPIEPEREDGRNGLGWLSDCAPLPAEPLLRSEHVDAIVALDGAYCGADLPILAARMHLPLAVGLGAMVGVPLPDGTRVASAGIFPLSPARTASEPRLAGWLASGRPPPSWWMALGRDAAVLAAAAVRDLADTANADEVRARRVEATAKLAAAQSELWTSDAKGFDAERKLPRAIRVLRSGSGAAK